VGGAGGGGLVGWEGGEVLILVGALG